MFIEEGYQGKLVAWFHKPSTSMLWKYWRNSDPKHHRLEDVNNEN